jgi:hypothetical protein
MLFKQSGAKVAFGIGPGRPIRRSEPQRIPEMLFCQLVFAKKLVRFADLVCRFKVGIPAPTTLKESERQV